MALLALWNPNIQFLKTDGTINAGGKILVTDHNDAESIPANYSDADGTTLNASPIVLDALGRATCYIDDGSTYDLYVKDVNGATLWTVPEMTPGTETIVVRGGFSVSSNDRSVAVTISVDSDGVTKYDLSIQNEIDRAKEAEKGLADAIETEKNRAEGVESTLSESISEETERAIAAEKASRTEIVAGDNITVEKTVGADGQDVYTIDGDNLVDDVRVNGASVVTGKVANIDVPVSGTASPLMDGKASVGNSLKYAREDHVHPTDTSREDKANKTTVVLGTSDSKYPTDKAVAEFVNSSIATNTANYISNNGEPFTSVEQLEAYSGTVTNNDYAFVTGTDSEGNTYYDRYKATVSGETVTWALEYRLNNSSFTAAQWSAINSGITSALVAKIHTHSNKDVLDGITSDKVTSWDEKEDAFNVLPTTKGGTGMNAARTTELAVALINSLGTGNSTPEDADFFVSQRVGGGTTFTAYYRRPVSTLWDYIKRKISSVLGLTASAYSGKAATAGTADKAVEDNSGNNIEETYATKSELNAKQNNLTAGDNITIANNVISAINVLKPKDISDDPNKDFNNLPGDNVLYYKKSTSNFANQPKVGAYRFIQWTFSLYYSVQIAIDGNASLFVRSSFRKNSSDKFKTWDPWIKLQENLTFDSAPTAGSNNPVTSDGIKKAIDSAAGSATAKKFTGYNTSNIVTGSWYIIALKNGGASEWERLYEFLIASNDNSAEQMRVLFSPRIVASGGFSDSKVFIAGHINKDTSLLANWKFATLKDTAGETYTALCIKGTHPRSSRSVYWNVRSVRGNNDWNPVSINLDTTKEYTIVSELPFNGANSLPNCITTNSVSLNTPGNEFNASLPITSGAMFNYLTQNTCKPLKTINLSSGGGNINSTGGSWTSTWVQKDCQLDGNGMLDVTADFGINIINQSTYVFDLTSGTCKLCDWDGNVVASAKFSMPKHAFNTTAYTVTDNISLRFVVPNCNSSFVNGLKVVITLPTNYTIDDQVSISNFTLSGAYWRNGTGYNSNAIVYDP